MSDNKVTLDQLDNSAVEAMSSSVGDVSLLNTENKTIVGALAEIVGKKEIANAIGEPLAETDKFTEMSSEINGLLSTFKTNMMNAGVVVESGDKFKALIDKIKGLTEGEGNKGVQFAEGTADNINLLGNSNTGWVEHKVNINVPFTPNRIILYVEKMVTSSSSGYYIKSFNVDSEYCFSVDSCFTLLMYGATYLYITDITNEGFSVYTKSNITTGKTNEFVFQNIRWYAIGVGEEDTTLRDSLADILENKGVDVTEEDDIASLITKVDSISGGLDIISATELPDTGKENQLCAITNNPVSNFKITTDITSTYDCPDDIIMLYSGEAHEGVQLYEYINGVVTFNYYFTKTQQGKNGLYLYYYNNGVWNNLTQGYMPFVENGVLVNTDYFGGIPSGSWKIANNALYLNSPGVRYIFITTANKIDFSLFNTVEITARIAGVEYGISSNALDLSVFYWTSPLNNVEQYSNLLNEIKTVSSDISKKYTFSEESVTKTIDISSWTGDYYFGIYWYTPYPHKCYITNITFK